MGEREELVERFNHVLTGGYGYEEDHVDRQALAMLADTVLASYDTEASEEDVERVCRAKWKPLENGAQTWDEAIERHPLLVKTLRADHAATIEALIRTAGYRKMKGAGEQGSGATSPPSQTNPTPQAPQH